MKIKKNDILNKHLNLFIKTMPYQHTQQQFYFDCPKTNQLMEYQMQFLTQSFTTITVPSRILTARTSTTPWTTIQIQSTVQPMLVSQLAQTTSTSHMVTNRTRNHTKWILMTKKLVFTSSHNSRQPHGSTLTCKKLFKFKWRIEREFFFIVFIFLFFKYFFTL